MNHFSKKTETVLTCVFLAVLIASGLLILYSNSLLYLIQHFLEEKVYHRTFEISKWADTIVALIAFPVTAVILCYALLFLKFSDRTKIIFMSAFAVFAVFFIGLCSFTKGKEFMNSDIASEILLAKECYLKKSFWPLSWHYSTEFRLLNTQLVAAPLFFFTSNWYVVKTVSAVILSLILPVSMYFLLSKLNVRPLWLKLLCCLLSLCPTSLLSWDVIYFGNFYIPHIAMEFVYLGLFFDLAYNETPSVHNKDNTPPQLSIEASRSGKVKPAEVIFFILSFICGLSSIRYILQFQLPLAAVLCSYALAQFFKEKQTFNFRKFFIENVPVFFSCAGLVLGAIGYVVNSTVLARLFSFSDFNRIRFSTIGDVSFTRLFSDIAMIFGYKNRVSVMTPAGIVNVLFYVSLVFFIVSTVSFLKKKEMSVQKVFITFTVVMLLFNGFVYINTEYTPRYFIILFACIPVCLAVYAAEKDFSAVKRYISLISFSCMCLISCVIAFEDVMTKDPATDKKDVAEFLEKSPYTFGYATFWNANVFSYLTNGKMEIAVLKRTEKDENVHITKTFNCQQWLTPDRFYNRKENTSPVCLIVTENEYTTTPDHPLFAKGRLVYKDDFYRVFEFESDVAFKESF